MPDKGRMPSIQPSGAALTLPTGLLQRKCACGGGGAGMTGDCAECSKKRLSRRASSPPTPSSDPTVAPPIVHEVLRSPGESLDSKTLSFMETNFARTPIDRRDSDLEQQADRTAEAILREPAADTSRSSSAFDFSRVRIHTDERAAASARSVHATAYSVGHDIVFATGQYSPSTPSGQRLLAHELTHTLQQTNHLSRQADDESPLQQGTLTGDLSKALGRKLPERKPQRSPGLTGLSPGTEPCLTGKICEPPVKGSASDFVSKETEGSVGHPDTLKPATEVKKAAEKLLPGVLSEIYEVKANPEIPETVGAWVDSCKAFNVAAPEGSSCIEVPTHLEEEAVRYNQGEGCLNADWKPGEYCEDSLVWESHFEKLVTHEAAHVAFKRRMPVGISSRTMPDDITRHELSEIYAQFSEFPLHYRRVQGVASREKDPAEGRRIFKQSMQAWIGRHVESQGEGFRGMLTKLRCVNPCDKVQVLVRNLMESVMATWPDDMKNTLLQELSSFEGLDWPMPADSLRPAADRPKMPRLFEPRTTFVPQIEQSVEDLP